MSQLATQVQPNLPLFRGSLEAVTMKTPGRLTGWATLAVLLFAYESPGSAQPMGNKMSADQRTELAGKLVTDKASTDGSFTIAQTNGTNRR
jgi:hypothetical protein